MICLQLWEQNINWKKIIENQYFKKGNFLEFRKIITAKQNIDNLHLYLNSLYLLINQDNNNYFNRIQIKKIFSLYVLLLYPEINNVKYDLEIHQKLLGTSKIIQYQLRNICLFITEIKPDTEIGEKNIKYHMGFLPIVKSLFLKIEQYLIYFEKWKEIDLEHIIFNLAYNQYHLDLELKKSTSYPIEYRRIYQLEKRKIKSHVRELDGNNGIIKLEDYLDIIREFELEHQNKSLEKEELDKLFAHSVSKLMKTNVRMNFWDELERELEEYQYEKLEHILKEIKEIIKKCLPSKDEIKVELEEYIDEKFIVQQIKSKVLGIQQVENLLKYLLGWLAKLQCEEEDEWLSYFRIELDDLIFDSECPLSFIIRFCLETITLKFENIAADRDYFIKLWSRSQNN